MLTERHGSPNAQQMDIHHFHHPNPATINTEDNMHTFREALSIASECKNKLCLFAVALLLLSLLYTFFYFRRFQC